MHRTSLWRRFASFLICVLVTCSTAGEGPLRPEPAPAGDLCPVEEIAAAPLGPVMEVRGNGYLIPDGDVSPTSSDGTDFGWEYVDERTEDHYFTIHNVGDENLVLSGPLYVSLSGDESSDFDVRLQPADIVLAPNEQTNFAILFEPNRYGERRTTVYIYSNDGNSPYTFRIQGGDDDDDGSHIWYASCGMTTSDREPLDWFAAVAVLLLVAALRRKFATSAGV